VYVIDVAQTNIIILRYCSQYDTAEIGNVLVNDTQSLPASNKAISKRKF